MMNRMKSTNCMNTACASACAEASFACACAAMNSMMLLGAILLASIFVCIWHILGLRIMMLNLLVLVVLNVQNMLSEKRSAFVVE